MELPREYKLLIAGLTFILGGYVAYLGALVFKVNMVRGFPTLPAYIGVLLVMLFLDILAATIMSAGLDILIEIIGAVSEEDSIQKILKDIPNLPTQILRERVTRLILIREEELILLNALKKTLHIAPSKEGS